MASIATLLTIAAGFTQSLALDAPTKPAIDPAFDMQGKISSGITQHLASTAHNISVWAHGWIPESCKIMGESEGYPASSFDVFQVAYADCDQPWIMCRQKESKTKVEEMAEVFGKIPLGMREYNAHLISVPEFSSGWAALTQGASTMLRDGVWHWSNVLVHEVTHSVDAFAHLPVAPDGLSTSQVWRDNYSQDRATISDYGRANWFENLAETAAPALYNLIVPGGLKPVQPNFTQVFHQYATFQTYYRDIMTPGSKTMCTYRQNNSAPVPMDGTSREFVPPPDTSINSRIAILKPGPLKSEIYHYEAQFFCKL
ncbi:hypothetical protein F5Y15DRAFT_418210 [Xylariaceae sp. FL0016]|nr:hypothetical protein F5Y15DRAFT_418210 [Xylariaceae sp. FL0016]